MSQQGPIIVVSTVAQLAPAAVLVASIGAAEPGFKALAQQIAARKPYLPLIAVDPTSALPENAIPFSQDSGNFDRLIARLRAALRVRTLHATVMRRIDDDPAAHTPLADGDPLRDATVLLIGRGAAYPSLSVSLGERLAV